MEVTVATGTVTGRTINLGTNSADIVVNPENTILYGVNTAGQIRAFDTATGNLLGQYTIDYPAGVVLPGQMQFNSLALDRDGNLITAAEYFNGQGENHRHIWKVVNKQQLANPSLTNIPTITATPLTQPLKNAAVKFGSTNTTFVGDLHIMGNGDILALVATRYSNAGINYFMLYPRTGVEQYDAPKPVGIPKLPAGNSFSDPLHGITYHAGMLLYTHGNQTYYTNDIPKAANHPTQTSINLTPLPTQPNTGRPYTDLANPHETEGGGSRKPFREPPPRGCVGVC